MEKASIRNMRVKYVIIKKHLKKLLKVDLAKY